ncbi:MAG TPA: hypothetical protein VFE10_08140 [Phenylobacterium sp.]|jgi:hypothetical protein|nr:hypothetical protein [Phenylobacterium sp.]
MPPRNAVHPLVQSGMLLIGAAAVLADLAWAHMRSLSQTYGEICGSGSGVLAHCPACYGSALFLALGVAALGPARTTVQPFKQSDLAARQASVI